MWLQDAVRVIKVCLGCKGFFFQSHCTRQSVSEIYLWSNCWKWKSSRRSRNETQENSEKNGIMVNIKKIIMEKLIMFISSHSLWENWQKMFCRWFITPSVIAKIDKLYNYKCWKCYNKKGNILPNLLFIQKKTQVEMHQKEIQQSIQRILKIKFELGPQMSLWSMSPGNTNEKYHNLIGFMLTATRISLAQHWKIE